MIVGLDHDDHQELKRTIDFLKDINIGSVVLWVLTPLPGTDLYEEMKLNGRITDTDWSKYDASKVVYAPLHFTPKELNDEFWEIYLELYSLQSIFKHTMHFFRSSKKPLSQLLIDLKLQFYTRAQLKDHTHPMAMGVHRI